MKLTSILKQIESRPKAIILIGPPKSGKTRWLEEYQQKNKLSNYINLNIDAFNAPEERAVMLSSCLENKSNFIYEGVVLKEDRISKLIEKVKKNNYCVRLVYIKKNLTTLLENNDDKNFDVKLKKLYKKSEDIYIKFKDKVDWVTEVK